MKILREDSEFTPRQREAAIQGVRNAADAARQQEDIARMSSEDDCLKRWMRGTSTATSPSIDFGVEDEDQGELGEMLSRLGGFGRADR